MKLLILLIFVACIMPATSWAQAIGRNLFREAGYSESAINEKVSKVYHDLFEGPHKVYFEVGDSMAYVSDLKNHDARTEG